MKLQHSILKCWLLILLLHFLDSGAQVQVVASPLSQYDDNPKTYWDQILMKLEFIQRYLWSRTEKHSFITVDPLSCLLPNLKEGRVLMLEDCNNLGK